MTDQWCPFAERAPVPGHGSGAGSLSGGGWKIAHHTTEGDSYAGAFATYGKTGDLPHFTDTFEGGVYRVVQHLPVDVAATALKHPKGTGETNHNNVIQIEHVGHTATSATWAPGYLLGIAKLSRWIEATVGVSPRAGVQFGPGAKRMTWDDWNSYSGHLGHQHVPFNDHVDPGAIGIVAVLSGVPAPSPGPGPVPDKPSWTITTIPDDPEDAAVQQTVYHLPQLDGQGNGWVLFDGKHAALTIPWAKVRGVEVQGSFPPTDGYWPLPRVGRQNRDGFLCVEVLGGAPEQPVNLLITALA
jgi:hypothetical protein